ncbi:MAG: O-antigen ligase family protein [Elusimicrobiales bacterium]
MGFLIFLTVFYSKGYGLKGYILWMYIALIIFLIEEIIGSSHKGNTNLMAFIFIIFSGLLLEEKRYYHAVIFFVSILITKSIAAVFSILVAALVYLFDNRKAIEWKNNAFAISVICVLCFSLFYFVDVSSLTDRFEWWKVGVRMFLERPFAGWGYSSFTYILPAFSHSSLKTLYTHNHFLSVLCEGGILAFVVWIYFIARTLTSAFGVSRYVLVAVFVDSFFDIGPDTSCGWWLVMFYIAKSLKTRSSPLIIVSIEYKKIAYGLIVIAVFFLLKFICFSYSLWKIEKTVKEIFSSSDIHSSIILADKALKNYPKSIDIAEARAYAYLKLARSNPPAIIDYLKSLEYILVLNPYRDDIYNILLKYYSKADRKVYRDIFLRKNKYIKIK